MVTMTVHELASMSGHKRRWQVVMEREEEKLVFTVNIDSQPTLDYMRTTIRAMIRAEDEEAQKTSDVDACNERDIRIRKLRKFL